MIIGYARVSSNHQDTELQMQALRAAGCKLIFEEKASGRKTNRPILKKVVEMLEPGDELVIWKLDRIGRNVLHALLTFQSLAERNVNIRSITDGVDLSTASGRYNFRNILSAAQYESDLNSERTLAGLAVARSRGRVGGRRPKFTDDDWNRCESALKSGKTHKEVSAQYGIGISTLYKKFPSSMSVSPGL
ncbi:recombinase family protein [Citrobacter freundii]|nr:MULTISPECIES: recombinase family protein [Kluyvera]MCE9890754.1 recombinase family protein [Kluyvera intermedia]MDA8488579.1 recombinase family protein [Kluyvera sp. Awk 3]MEA8878360.1 recombinase family protein [Citrobacter freundii]HAT7513548.1 recombinase family protein [Kluyvera ascorbata]